MQEDAHLIVSDLLDKYTYKDEVVHIGNYLKLFTDSPVLVDGWFSILNIRKLFSTLKSEDFTVESMAIETA